VIDMVLVYVVTRQLTLERTNENLHTCIA